MEQDSDIGDLARRMEGVAGLGRGAEEMAMRS